VKKINLDFLHHHTPFYVCVEELCTNHSNRDMRRVQVVCMNVHRVIVADHRAEDRSKRKIKLTTAYDGGKLGSLQKPKLPVPAHREDTELKAFVSQIYYCYQPFADF
jgi:hypothetical protein